MTNVLRSALFSLLLLSGTAHADTRVVALGGPITEIIYALGAGDQLVGADASSIYPPAANTLPKVGYYRSFSIEGVASLKPDLVLASDQAGPPNALAQLQKLGSKVVVLPSEPDMPALEKRIAGVANALGMPERGQEAILKIRGELARLPATGQHVRVLLVSSHTGKLQGAGDDTAGAAMLKLVGATNVLASQKGYKPFSAEAAAALRPDVIVTTTLSVGASGSLDAFLAQPGLSVTPAAKARRVIVMDDLLLLGFGPRLPEALRQLQAGIAGKTVAEGK
ncbi:MAG: hemin ABC transporter substrate-binding protein [Rhodocyclaceae bacterium]